MKKELSQRTLNCYATYLEKFNHLDFDEPELVFEEISKMKNQKSNKKTGINHKKTNSLSYLFN